MAYPKHPMTNEIIKFWKDGLPLREISTLTGASESRIVKITCGRGLRRNGKIKEIFTNDSERLKTMTWDQIAKENGLTWEQVRRACHRYQQSTRCHPRDDTGKPLYSWRPEWYEVADRSKPPVVHPDRSHRWSSRSTQAVGGQI